MKCNYKSHKGFGFVIFMLYYYNDTLHINSLQDLIVRYWRYQYVISSSVNPLLPEFFYRRFSGQRKIGSFCLPTHSHDAHRKFFYDLFLSSDRNFGTSCTFVRTRL